MKEQHKDLDQMTRELMSKSILKPESSDFDSRLMAQVLAATAPGSPSSNGSSTRRAWMFWMMTVVFLVTSLFIISEYLADYFTELSQALTLTVNYVFYGGMALFIPFVLFQLDNLLQVNTARKRNIGEPAT